MKNSDLLKKYVELIIISGPELFSYLYDRKGEELEEWLLSYVNNYDSSFSKHYIIGDEKDSELRGMVLALPVAELTEKSKNEIKLIRQNLNGTMEFIKYMAKGIFRMGLAFRFPKLNKDEFFISNIAVYDQFRGQGIGTNLLIKAEDEAKKQGYEKMCLYVETDNDLAIRVYEKHGYQLEKLKNFPKRYYKHHLYGLCKMIKTL